MANRLKDSASPYLLQHQNNPVDWYEWGPDAFARAQAESKPIFLSIGYATCHWCHVMEKDSFEQDDVALALNTHFVAIKVDREERPDIDRVYMQAVQLMQGHGGWPLTVLLLPDGTPFWGATFLPRSSLLQLLNEIHLLWTSQAKMQIKEQANQLGDALTKSLSGLSNRGLLEVKTNALNELPQKLADAFLKNLDPQYGGLGRAPKFPPHLAVLALLRIQASSPSDDLLNALYLTADGMTQGGLFDQVGGGFHRYTVDEAWAVPHFEKMLYDNALLAQVYGELFQLTHHDPYRAICERTAEYVIKHLSLQEGGYASGEDADSEGFEGKFYIWQEEHLQSYLNSEELSLFKLIPFSAHRTGSEVDSKRRAQEMPLTGFILHRASHVLANDPKFLSACRKLDQIREQRERPARDYKMIAGWNALMISSLFRCGQILKRNDWIRKATDDLQAVQTLLWNPQSGLRRSYAQGRNGPSATSEDYALVIQACLDAQQFGRTNAFFKWAQELQSKLDECFLNNHIQGSVYKDHDNKDPHLSFQTENVDDHVIPSPNSTSFRNLLRLAELEANPTRTEQALKLWHHLDEHLVKTNPLSFSQWVTAACEFFGQKPRCLLIVCGQPTKDWSLGYRPWVGSVYKRQEDDEETVPILKGKKTIEVPSRGAATARPTFYLCKADCSLPTMDWPRVEAQLTS